MAALWAAVEQQIKDNPELRLAIVPSLEIHCPPKYERRRTIWGYKELLRWTQPVRSMIIENRLAHTGELQLIEHCERAVMVKHQGSIALSSARSPGPIELARCMVVAAALSSRPSGGGKPMLIVTKR
jgi:EAL domain-containing protein (putative c-di-GMP-specific phosphodiesterase class I)